MNGVKGKHYRNMRTRLWFAQQGRCFYCNCKILKTENATLDHVIPRSLGGWNAIWNLVATCRPCNIAKGNRMPTDAEMDRRAALEEVVQSIQLYEGKPVTALEPA